MDTKLQGLTAEEVKIKLQQSGLNILPENHPPGNWLLLARQLKSPLIYVLLLAGLVTLAIGHYPDAAIIAMAVAVNSVLGFAQERRATNALHALRRYVASKVTVIREGRRMDVDTSGLVPGDVVILSQGVKVPADGKLVQANRFYVDESVLTGESASVSKAEEDLVSMGSTVAAGQAVMIIEQTGAETKMGAIALQVQEPEEDTPIQRQLKEFSRQLVVLIGILITVVFGVGIWYRYSLTEVFVTSVALAVSSIPEGLVISMTVVLAIGMQKILRRRGLVRRLTAAETLGGVTVVCVDKTGTLTQGKMKVVDCIGDKKEIAEQVLLANDLDDPIVIAAFEWGRTIITDFVSKHRRLDSIPFSPTERFFTSLHYWTKDTTRLYVNGAPELLLGWTTLSDVERSEVLEVINELTGEGKRLIGSAQKDMSGGRKQIEGRDAKTDLRWLGMLAFSDPVRRGVKEALELSRKAGIQTMVITGDYAKTSEFVLAELGMAVDEKQIITGEELGAMTPTKLAQMVKTIRLFARTTPDQKLKIVQSLRKNGEIVAMMGDGVNADIGIAVGEATDVAKESADLILLDSNFSTIVAAIEEGRIMFENIRKIILYLLSDAFAEILVVFGGIILGLPLPLTAIQILWINLVSDGFPNLALTIDPKREGTMEEKPRPPGDKLVNRWMLVLIGIVSGVAGLFGLVSFVVVLRMSGDIKLAQSMTFLTLGLNSLVYVFSVRALMAPFWKNHMWENKWLLVAVMMGVGLQVLPFMTPELREFFGLRELGSVYWLVAGGLSVAMFFVVEMFKLVYQWMR